MTHFFLIAEHVDGGWRPGIGDPSIMGWITVVAYFAAAIACGLAARAEGRLATAGHPLHPIFWRFDTVPQARPTGPSGADRRVYFWWGLMLGMAILGINKQLDLQSILPIVGRRIAHEQGWYEDRKAVQQAFILGVAILGVGVLGLLTFVFRSVVFRRPLAPIGLVFLYLFVLVRASSFHHVDMLLHEDFLGIRINWLLELGGIACVFASAMRLVIQERHRSTLQ